MNARGATARSEDTLPSNNELALQRTRLAQERTMMAWIRTSVSLISFGFSVYKFFDYFQEKQAASAVIGPRRFALFLIGIGLFVLVAAVAQHWWEMRTLHTTGSARKSLATVVAAMVAIVGVLAFISVILRQ